MAATPDSSEHMYKSDLYSSSGSSIPLVSFSSSENYICKQIVKSLREALKKSGFCTVADERYPQSRIKASSLKIVVLSQDFASNSELLNELVNVVILKQQQVVPIYYLVNQNDVRSQTGIFGEAFRIYTDMKQDKMMVETWRAALTQIGSLSGYHLSDDSKYGLNSVHIDEIVEIVKGVVGAPKIFLNILSTGSRDDTMEVQVDFAGGNYDQFDIKELLDLMKNIFHLMKSKFVAVRNLKMMHIWNYKLSDIPDNISFPDLEELVLHPNPDLTHIPSSFFERMLSLKVLDMSYTSILNLPASISKLIRLEKLLLKGCRSLLLPESLSKLRSLRYLNLNPESFAFPQSLSSLDLGFCDSLTKLPQEITSLKKLEYFSIAGCTNLVEIPESIDFLQGCDTLDLSYCRSLTKLPESIGKLVLLKKLRLNGCANLAELSFDLPPNLSNLYLTECKSLTKLPERMSELRSLEYIYLDGCTNLPELPINLPQNLLYLGLSDCKSLTKLPKAITMMTSLRLLSLSGCPSLFETSTELNDLESPTKSYAAKVSVDKLSTTGGGEIMEVELNFPKGDGTIFDITELLGLMNKVMEYRFRQTKYVAVRKLRVIHIGNFNLFEIPHYLTFPDLEMLFLHSNIDLTDIPSTLFEKMPALKVLDISSTSIKTLPPSVSNLINMEKISFRGCELLMELPQEICTLLYLKELDFGGIDLVCLPKEIGNLIQLKCLKLSLYDAESYRDSKGIVAIIPDEALSSLAELEEVSIKIVPRDIWCDDAVKAVIKDLPGLKKVKTLELYLPTTELFKDLIELKRNDNGLSIYQALSNFNFIIGPDGQRFISRLPCDLDEEFMKLKKCLKYVNGVGSTDKFGKALEHANALYIDRHWTIQKLSVFRLEGLKKLVFCLLVDCNEMHTVFDGSDLYPGEADNEDSYLALQYLAIHYLKNLEVIWKGAGVGCWLRSLKVLTLHMCPNLSTIFTKAWLGYLVNLKEIIVEDCPKIKTLIAEDESEFTFKEILPGLKTLSLFYLPELESISNTSLSIAPNLESLLIIDCPKLKMLFLMGELNESKINTKGEEKWWDDLKWNEPEWSDGHEFSKLDVGVDPYQVSLDELTPGYGNSLRLLVKEYNDILNEKLRLKKPAKKPGSYIELNEKLQLKKPAKKPGPYIIL